jgi:hypothetical protein
MANTPEANDPASAPCLLSEMADNPYSGFAAPDEVRAFLTNLQHAEHLLLRITEEVNASMPPPLPESVHAGLADSRACLRLWLGDHEGTAARPCRTRAPERLKRLCLRGHARAARAITAFLPRIADDRLHGDLRRLRDGHHAAARALAPLVQQGR